MNQRPFSLNDDPWMMVGFLAMSALLSAGLVLWIGALVAVWISGGGWQASDGGSAGTFLAELLGGTSPAHAWAIASGSSSTFAPAWLFWIVTGAMALVIGVAVLGVWKVFARRTKKNNDAHWAAAGDESLMVVPDD